MKNFKKIVSNLLITVLIVAMALTLASCNKKEVNQKDETSQTDTLSDSGQKEKSFTFTVVDENGNETAFSILSTKKTVSEALLEEGLIEGKESQYGLFVKKVNGIVADYDVDKTYWAFYVNGQYASSGVDTTEIENGATYSFKKEK